ncbi:MAG: exodeoxyribonuclease III, partial [Pseudomonadota bacterium]|nr:exodeoxyribonuclease III [Pseudomonadota bacterium]
RILDDSNSIFTQWDYRDRAWKENNGVRIDHILLSPNAADKLEKSWIETSLRDKSKPSDHVPVWALLK